MKQFLIEQIHVLFFIAVFFMMLARIGIRNDIKNMARNEMKQFLIEQIPALFFIAVFFMMLALGG